MVSRLIPLSLSDTCLHVTVDRVECVSCHDEAQMKWRAFVSHPSMRLSAQKSAKHFNDL